MKEEQYWDWDACFSLNICFVGLYMVLVVTVLYFVEKNPPLWLAVPMFASMMFIQGVWAKLSTRIVRHHNTKIYEAGKVLE